MSTILGVIGILLGMLLFCFCYWRALKEDYVLAKVFSSSLYLSLGVVLGGIVGLIIAQNLSKTSIFLPSGLWFWGSLMGFLIGLFLSKFKFKFRINEMVEASVPGFLYWGAVLLTTKVLLFVAWILLIGLYYYLRKNYKRFTWYRSGKVGFAGYSVVGVFFLLRATIAIFFMPNMVSFIGKVDGILASAIAFLAFMGLYSLSGIK